MSWGDLIWWHTKRRTELTACILNRTHKYFFPSRIQAVKAKGSAMALLALAIKKMQNSHCTIHTLTCIWLIIAINTLLHSQQLLLWTQGTELFPPSLGGLEKNMLIQWYFWFVCFSLRRNFANLKLDIHLYQNLKEIISTCRHDLYFSFLNDTSERTIVCQVWKQHAYRW